MKVHVDTDFGGDTDDACAIGLILGSTGVELLAATTVADPEGWRAGYVEYFVELAGHDVPIAAGAGRSLTTSEPIGRLPDHMTYWGQATVAPKRRGEAAAIELLEASIEAGATVIAIGPYTNLALLEAARPGVLAGARVVVMGGWITPPRPGLPPWRADMDWNVQCDIAAAETVFRAAGELILVTLPATLDAHLRRGDLGRLRASGAIGQLLARQAEAHGEEHNLAALGRAHAHLPDDLLNFQYDVVACAVAIGMPVAVLEDRRLTPRRDGDVLHFEEAANGRPAKVTAAVDGDRLNDMWIASIQRADALARSRA